MLSAAVKPFGRRMPTVLLQMVAKSASSSNNQMSSLLAQYQSYETLLVTSPNENVYHVQLNRPKQLNAMNQAFWREMAECFHAIDLDNNCRCVVLSANGKHFTAGLDLTDMAPLLGPIMDESLDVARKFRILQPLIKAYQESFTSIEQCSKPVITAIHGGCIGGGVDLTTASDIRFCTSDAFFQVKEVDIGLAADVGTLQRLPKVIGSDSLVRELCLTARKMFADEALTAGLVSKVLADKESLIKAALDTAVLIASKSPVAVQGTKHHLNYSRDHSIAESLDYIVTWNAAHLQSEDLRIAAVAAMDKNGPAPVFPKL